MSNINEMDAVPVTTPKVVALPFGDDIDKKQKLYATEIFEHIHSYKVMNAIQNTDFFRYGFVNASLEEIKIREEYKLIVKIGDDIEEFSVKPDTDEEKRNYRKMYKNPDSMFVALVSVKDKNSGEWKSEYLVDYSKGSQAKHIIDFATKIFQIFLDNSEFKTKREVSNFIDKFAASKDNKDLDKLKEEKFLNDLRNGRIGGK